MSLPDVDIVRARIESVDDDPIRYCLMTAYLYAGRISEVISKVYASDSLKTEARGPRGIDAKRDFWRMGDLEEGAVVWTVRTAKREGVERKVAVPIKYESWALPLYEHFKSFGKQMVFPFYQQNVRRYCYEHEVFKGLIYPIETYTIWRNGQLTKKVGRHSRPFTLHALRHLRASELVDFFGFNGPELATYGGWAFRSVGFPTAADRYLSLGWQSYFPKLLKRRY